MKTLMKTTIAIMLLFSLAEAQQNPVLLGPIDPGDDDVFHGWMSRDVSNGYMYFKMYDGTGSEIHPTNPTMRVGCLWRTDGTQAGTSQYAEAQVSGEVRAIGDLVYFSGADPSANNWDDPWRSDGTVSGTYRLIDLGKRLASSSDDWDFESFNGAVYFKHYWNKRTTTTSVHELLVTNGTTSGTSVVSAGLPWTFDLTPLANELHIYSWDLWTSNGTGAGTVLLKDICPGTTACGAQPYSPMPRPYEDSYYRRPFVKSGVYYARFADGINGDELWKSDGTAAGTVMVKDINPGSGSSWPSMFAEMDGVLYFAAYDAENGMELWKSDGTAAGTVLVKDINLTGNSEPLWITAVTTLAGKRLFFSADDGVNGRELWISDGTAAGTTMVVNINTTGSSNPRYTTFADREYRCSDERYMHVMTSFSGVVYFGADDGNGYELWKSDGTANGTVKLVDINPSGSSYPMYVTVVNGKVLFFAYEPTYGYEWYSYDPGQPVNLNLAPSAEIIATPTQGNDPLYVAFDGTGSADPDGTIDYYEWDFGDGNSDGGAAMSTASHTYLTPNTYIATLTVTDNDHATRTATVTITVTSSSTLDIFVDQQTVTRSPVGGGRYAGQSVILAKGNNGTVSGAVVSATYTGPTSGSVSGTTDQSGFVTLATSSTKKNLSSDWCFTVTDILKNGYTFDEQVGEPADCEGTPKKGTLLPSSCVLQQPYPNPFGTGTITGSSAAVIRFDLKDAAQLSLRVYDALGRLVSTLVEGLHMAGLHTAQFQAGELPSGIYFVRLTSADGVQSMRVVLQK